MKLSDVKPGITIEWEETLDAYRGSFKTHRATVVAVSGKNIETDMGDWLWWPKLASMEPRATGERAR